jgi:LytS/YehU family sensor histidine kinase
VPLADDLAFAENYLEIERLRLGDRLTVEIAVDENALDVQVPFLTLQPLVENAIRHGIDPKLAGGTVRIAATQDGATLTIVVSDDGAGAPNGAAPSNGVGLGALRQRLALSYDRFEVTVDARPDAGCAVTVSIPA